MSESAITLTLSLDEVNTILAGLGELPAKQSFNVIARVQSQAQGQVVKSEEVQT